MIFSVACIFRIIISRRFQKRRVFSVYFCLPPPPFNRELLCRKTPKKSSTTIGKKKAKYHVALCVTYSRILFLPKGHI